MKNSLKVNKALFINCISIQALIIINRLSLFIKTLPLLLLFFSCHSQQPNDQVDKQVGGPCEGCEALLEYGEKVLTNTDTLPGFFENEPKLKITGTVYHKDAKTPAKDVILYIYQTNRKGLYESKGNEQGWAKRHGYVRGWVKTKDDGTYTFYTFRPAAYPNGVEPEHIHITIKEPGKTAYYIDEYVFDDDPMLNEKERQGLNKRCGSGVLKVNLESGILTAKRDLILGLNIPNYD